MRRSLSNSSSENENTDKPKKFNSPSDLLQLAQEMMAPLIAAAAGQSGARLGRHRLALPAKEASVVEILPAKEPNHTFRQPLSERDLEDRIIDLYAKGLTTTDIVNHLREIDGIEMSGSGISAITDKVFPLVKEWQARPLSSQYPLLYLDGLHFKVRDSGKIVSKCAFIALGINELGLKEVLGIWIADTEGAKFWLSILTEIKNRGVESVLIACVDGLRGFPEAIKTVYPEAVVQTCIIHQVRHTVKFVSHKDREQFCNDLKSVYAAPTEEAGLQALEDIIKKWPQYNFCLKRWQQRWTDLAPFYAFPEQIRRIMYTTNAIENLNRQFRKVTKTTTVFPHDDSLIKLLWLAQDGISHRWTVTSRHWGQVLAQLAILFPDKMKIEN